MKYTDEYFLEFVKNLPNIDGNERIFFYGILKGAWAYHTLTKGDKNYEDFEKIIEIIFLILRNLSFRKGNVDKNN